MEIKNGLTVAILVGDPANEFQALAVFSLVVFIQCLFGKKKPFQECFVFYMQREVMAEDEVKLMNVSCFPNYYLESSNDP